MGLHVFKILKTVLRLFGIQFQSGKLAIFLDSEKTIHVKTGFTPKEVWVHFVKPEGIPVCHADHDRFDVRVTHGGFIIIAKLSSDIREIEWIAT
jgi:hypothetical protein